MVADDRIGRVTRSANARTGASGWPLCWGSASTTVGKRCADVRNWQDNGTLMLAEIYGDPNFVPGLWRARFLGRTRRGGCGLEEDRAPVRYAFSPAFLPDVSIGPAFVTAVDSPACQRALWSHAGLRYHPRGYIVGSMHAAASRMGAPATGQFTSAAAEDYRQNSCSIRATRIPVPICATAYGEWAGGRSDPTLSQRVRSPASYRPNPTARPPRNR